MTSAPTFGLELSHCPWDDAGRLILEGQSPGEQEQNITPQEKSYLEFTSGLLTFHNDSGEHDSAGPSPGYD